MERASAGSRRITLALVGLLAVGAAGAIAIGLDLFRKPVTGVIRLSDDAQGKCGIQRVYDGGPFEKPEFLLARKDRSHVDWVVDNACSTTESLVVRVAGFTLHSAGAVSGACDAGLSAPFVSGTPEQTPPKLQSRTIKLRLGGKDVAGVYTYAICLKVGEGPFAQVDPIIKIERGD